jgi:hypothetical protein
MFRRLNLESFVVGATALAVLGLSLHDMFSGLIGGKEFLSESKKIGAIEIMLSVYVLYVLVKNLGFESKLDDLLNTADKKDILTYDSRDKWLQEMAGCATSGGAISTQHFSDPPEMVGGKSKEYFAQVHRYVKKHPKTTYRRICSVGAEDGGRQKAIWIFETVLSLISADNFSLAVVNLDHKRYLLNCYEICRTGNHYRVFVFTSPPSHGEVKAFLIQDDKAGHAAQGAFDALWDASPKLKNGHNIDWNLLRELAERFKLQDDPSYLKLAAKRPPSPESPFVRVLWPDMQAPLGGPIAPGPLIAGPAPSSSS